MRKEKSFLSAAERQEALAAVIERSVADVDRLVAQAAGVGERVSASAADPLIVYGAGALLHAFYTEVEKILHRIARDLDGFEPRGEGWHAELLEEMTLDIEGARPAVLSSPLQRRLHDYLRFRHLFRNLYVLDLDPPKVAALLGALPGLWSDVRAALKTFAHTLRAIARGVRGA